MTSETQNWMHRRMVDGGGGISKIGKEADIVRMQNFKEQMIDCNILIMQEKGGSF